MIDKLTILCVLKLIYQLRDKGSSLFLDKIFKLCIYDTPYYFSTYKKLDVIDMAINNNNLIDCINVKIIHMHLFCIGQCSTFLNYHFILCNKCINRNNCFICKQPINYDHFDQHNILEVDKEILKKFIRNQFKVEEVKVNIISDKNDNIFNLLRILSYDDIEILKRRLPIKIFRIEHENNLIYIAAYNRQQAVYEASKNYFIKNINLTDIHIELFCKSELFKCRSSIPVNDSFSPCTSCKKSIKCYICKDRISNYHFTKHTIYDVKRKIIEQYIDKIYTVEEIRIE